MRQERRVRKCTKTNGEMLVGAFVGRGSRKGGGRKEEGNKEKWRDTRLGKLEKRQQVSHCQAPKREANKRRTGEVLFDLGVRTYICL